MSESESSDILSPRESGRFIAARANHVSIDDSAVQRTADLIISDPVISAHGDQQSQQYADHPTHPPRGHQHAADWVFLISTLNFSFWHEPGSEKYQVTYLGRPYTGYYALCAAIRRAMDECDEFVLPRYYAGITAERLSTVLRSDTSTSIPLLQERLQAMHEAGHVLLTKYGGSFSGCIAAASGSASSLVQLIVEDFKSFRDRAVYCSRSVAFYKRAQIAVSDISACCPHLPLCRFRDIDQLTMFADYRVPQVLHHLGVLRYSDELLSRLSADSPLPNGSELEVEIRGCCIEAVERIVGAARARTGAGTDDPAAAKDGTGHGATSAVNSATVDYFLWLYRRRFNDQIKSPYHKTRCIYY